ncbi:hypothetical protein [Okeania sp. SIO2B3]|uniref:hypothetical protein n=1 Tax=Okeania sp. SIO2B3 TaxID=2607784 RepID=UPI0013BFE2DC|nr:hypothetical protein [Okeania sp. SIO2B3]NET46780.1 hypothetical protein [Okeania sp. SIO2B3]
MEQIKRKAKEFLTNYTSGAAGGELEVIEILDIFEPEYISFEEVWSIEVDCKVWRKYENREADPEEPPDTESVSVERFTLDFDDESITIYDIEWMYDSW